MVGRRVTPIFKKGKEEDPESYCLVSLLTASAKAEEQVVIKAISRQNDGQEVIGNRQHVFFEDSLYLFSSSGGMTGFMDSEEKWAVYILSLPRLLTQVPIGS